MVKTSKICGVKLHKREIFVASATEWHNSSTYSHETLLKIFSTIKDASDAIIAKMDSSEMDKNHGLRRNVNFVIDMNLETEIVTRADDEGSKKYFIRPERPFERDVGGLVDDKDFETELTEDEEEFLNGRSDNTDEEVRGNVAVQGACQNVMTGVGGKTTNDENVKAAVSTENDAKTVVDVHTAQSIETKKVAAKDQHEAVLTGPRTTTMVNTSMEGRNNAAVSIDRRDALDASLNHTKNRIIDETVKLCGTAVTDGAVIDSIAIQKNDTKTTSVTSTSMPSTVKKSKSAHSKSNKDLSNAKKTENKSKKKLQTAKRQRLSDDRRPRRNIFSNFKPTLLHTPTEDEINEYYADFFIIKNPLKSIRCGDSPYVYYEVTEKKAVKKKITIRLKGKKKSIKDELIGKFFVSGDMSDEGEDVKF
ncbi:hypothetical protein THOM_2371 [Trachipleistophora hominis]|uniref:Uncharacterized protein n=1 Tax=Trachipleistophora hominis TaxID=72359 RepID=L7JTG4_TRAHO|nr:hypothetical protein THOM_2371 [Trachipleistophora hominis]